LTEEETHNYTVKSGTSGAACIVSGIIGRLIEFRRSYGLPTDPLTIKKVLVHMAQPLPSYQEHEIGAGFVSVHVADKYFNLLEKREIYSKELWGNRF